MATRHEISIGFLNLSEADRIPLTSALKIAAATLNTDLIWSEIHEADIKIVDVTKTDPENIPPVVIRYSTHQNGKPVDIVRPIHVRPLIETLGNAIKIVLMQRADQQRRVARTVKYRGAVVEQTEPAQRNAENSDSTTAARKKNVIYRGVRIE